MKRRGFFFTFDALVALALALFLTVSALQFLASAPVVRPAEDARAAFDFLNALDQEVSLRNAVADCSSSGNAALLLSALEALPPHYCAQFRVADPSRACSLAAARCACSGRPQTTVQRVFTVAPGSAASDFVAELTLCPRDAG